MNQAITKDTWVNLNTLFSVATGSPMRVINKGVSFCSLAESAVEPSTNTGNILTPIGKDYPPYGVIDVQAGGDDVWIYSHDRDGVVEVLGL